MQLILRPVSQPELEDIIVNDSLFAVGRQEEPFCRYQSGLVTRLSRRHARVFEQDGAVYLADLGSLNGTTVNGESVDGTPVRLNAGDRICFAGLCFEAEILGAAGGAAAEQPATPVELILTPEHAERMLEPIVVSRFPFLVNKRSEVFSRYADRLGEQVRYLSRRHAHIFVRHGGLFVEDLGSTNGTYVSGERLEEHARELRDGDVLAFGGDCFVYRVQLVHADPVAPTVQPGAGSAPAGEDITRTTFVTSANSFLDIFCSGDGEEQGSEAADVSAGQASQQAEEGRAQPSKPTHLARLRSSWAEIRTALAEEGASRPRRRWLVALLGAATVAAAAVYIATAPQRDIRESMEQGDYRQAALAAGRYLERHPGDATVTDLATEAMLRAIGPTWTRALLAGDFSAADAELRQARRLTAANPAGAELIEAMAWVARLEAFIAARGGPDAPIALFEEEVPIQQLLGWWEVDPNSRQRALGAVVQEVPQFAELRARALSHQRLLQSRKALELAAIERLRGTLEARLDDGRAQELATEIAEFGQRYPRVDGVQRLQQDLDRYLPIEADIAAGEWLEARRALDHAQFETPPFRSRAAALSATQLPSQDVMARYETALQAWQQGDVAQARRELEALTRSRWAQPAERELARLQRVQSEYDALRQAHGAPGYDDKLLAFYTGLDPSRDRYFIAAVQDEFTQHREQALQQASRAFASARGAWSEYRDQGGIRGLHRLEADVSATFRKLAATLSASYSNIAYATRVYGLLGMEYPKEWGTLYRQISNEVRLQRRSLAELSMVLEPSLKQAKLELIPVVQSDQAQAMRTDGADISRQKTR